MIPTADLENALQLIPDEVVRRLFANHFEVLLTRVALQDELIQSLRDEVNRLKGEQGKPKFPEAKTKDPRSKDVSSEKERSKPREWHKRPKLDRITIDRQEVRKVDRFTLPPDAVLKDHVSTVVQGLRLVKDNVCFMREKWYSASTKKTYLADLPPGYDGEFTPDLKTLALLLSFGCNVTQSKILELFRGAGTFISAGTLSNILIKGHGAFYHEYDEIYRAGLMSTPWQHTDHTMMKVKGEMQNCQVVCNPFYTIYATTKKKDRLSILKVLLNRTYQSAPNTFLINEDVHVFMETFAHSGFSRRVARALRTMPQNVELSEEQFETLLKKHVPKLSEYLFDKVQGAAAIAAYRSQEFWPTVLQLVADDAPQFKLITAELALCWVHEGRRYKKLCPALPLNRRILDAFLTHFWEYYDKLLAYRVQPTVEQAQKLSAEFDELFITTTGYELLDKAIARSLERKPSLLVVLTHPEIPLHNNAAELAVRSLVRKRDASLGTQTIEGTRAWDTWLSLADTCRKLGVSFQEYLQDRMSKTYAMPSLANLIEQRSASLKPDLS